jgi:hypothetical protein
VFFEHRTNLPVTQRMKIPFTTFYVKATGGRALPENASLKRLLSLDSANHLVKVHRLFSTHFTLQFIGSKNDVYAKK